MFHNPKVVNGPSQSILLIYKGVRSHVGKPFLPLGQIGDGNQFFLCDFRPIRPKQFTQLSCRLALTIVRAIFSIDCNGGKTRDRDCTRQTLMRLDGWSGRNGISVYITISTAASNTDSKVRY